MRPVVVTGATGFVGANLTRRLIRDGHEVHLLVRREYSGWRLEGVIDRLIVHEVDVADTDGIHQTLGRIHPEWVFHLAAYGAYPHQTDVQTMVRVNVLGTVNVVEASARAGAEVIVNAGSSSEYGYKDSAPSEEDPAEPNSAYAATKLSATLLCRELAHRFGVRIPTLRLYSVYGPFEEPTRLVPTLVTHALNGRLPPLANPLTARDFVYVDDVVEAFLLVAERPQPDSGVVFNVGTGVQSSIRALVDTLRELVPIADEPAWGTYPDRSWDTQSWVADSRRIQRDLGWFPRYPLAAGLRDLMSWLGKHPEHAVRYRRTG